MATAHRGLDDLIANLTGDARQRVKRSASVDPGKTYESQPLREGAQRATDRTVDATKDRIIRELYRDRDELYAMLPEEESSRMHVQQNPDPPMPTPQPPPRYAPTPDMVRRVEMKQAARDRLAQLQDALRRSQAYLTLR